MIPASPVLTAAEFLRLTNGRRPKGHAKRTRYYEPNGKREIARRLRQIEAGQLKVSA